VTPYRLEETHRCFSGTQNNKTKQPEKSQQQKQRAKAVTKEREDKLNKISGDYFSELIWFSR
jgi:hypothetical protein